jgi:hypothetical protein
MKVFRYFVTIIPAVKNESQSKRPFLSALFCFVPSVEIFICFVFFAGSGDPFFALHL